VQFDWEKAPKGRQVRLTAPTACEGDPVRIRRVWPRDRSGHHRHEHAPAACANQARNREGGIAKTSALGVMSEAA
jgi:hypothetical protein